MKNKVVSELGPDLATLRGECTILPPFIGIPRSFLFDGHVVCRPSLTVRIDVLRNLSSVFFKFTTKSTTLSLL